MSKWRERFPVHPATDVFPMMTDKELLDLGQDIKANGLKVPIEIWGSRGGDLLIDGRNRLEAMERAGIESGAYDIVMKGAGGDPTARIIGLNIHRRHLTKQERAKLIVAALKAAARKAYNAGKPPAEDKPRQVGEVSKGGRGKVDEVRAAAIAIGKEHDIGKRTIERAYAEPKPNPLPQAQRITARPMPKARSSKPRSDIKVFRDRYLQEVATLDLSELDAERDIIIGALREIAGQKARASH